jgi:hypothetical protein
MNSHRHLQRSSALVAGLASTAAILLTACGGSKHPAASTSGGSVGGHPGVAAVYRFAACMRQHGVSDFPDPHVKGTGGHTEVSLLINHRIASSPAFQSAQRSCQHLLPEGGNGPSPAQQRERAAAMLAFASCMRRHGFPKFPDPTSQGHLTLEMITQAGIDLRQPAVKPAAYACLPVTHGLLTRADVNQATASPNGGGSGGQSGSGG